MALNDDSRRVARVYAESLLDVAAECRQTDQVLEEFGALIDGVFPAAPEFETFLVSSVDHRKKDEVIRRAFDGVRDLVVLTTKKLTAQGEYTFRAAMRKKGSGTIVTINKDGHAPIFEYSDLGVVGDVHEIVPKLTELVRARG